MYNFAIVALLGLAIYKTVDFVLGLLGIELPTAIKTFVTLGLGVVLGRGEASRVTIVILLGVLNIAAEFFSFTAVIDRVGVLRAFDRLGTRPERRQLFD